MHCKRTLSTSCQPPVNRPTCQFRIANIDRYLTGVINAVKYHSVDIGKNCCFVQESDRGNYAMEIDGFLTVIFPAFDRKIAFHHHFFTTRIKGGNPWIWQDFFLEFLVNLNLPPFLTVFGTCKQRFFLQFISLF